MLKRLVKSAFDRMGFQISRGSRRAPTSLSSETGEWLAYQRLTPSGRTLYGEIHKSYPVFSPWNHDQDFLHLFEAVREATLLSADRCWVLYSLAVQQADRAGDFVECGVYRGGVAALLATLKRRTGRPDIVHLFDSFAGLPAGEKDLDPYWERGVFSDTSFESVKARLAAFDDVCAFYPGWIPSTFTPTVASRAFSFVHIDVDLYRPTLESCMFFWPRMLPGGVLVIDDYGFPSSAGVMAAVDEFRRLESILGLYIPTGQFIAIKRPIG